MPGRFVVVLGITLLTACAPDPGSDAWCERLERKPLLEWTAEEVKTYFGVCKAPLAPETGSGA
ncbi:MAG TPA: DUF3012 domain-containing protein [Pseudomonadales bacterium]